MVGAAGDAEVVKLTRQQPTILPIRITNFNFEPAGSDNGFSN
jgi:hypothetical protein